MKMPPASETEASMGTFVGHIVPGLAVALLGLWHTINTIRAYYLKGSTNFKSRFWYPFRSPLSKLEHLELIFILSFSIFAIFMQVINFPFLHFSFNLDNFEHATMFLHLAIFAGFSLSVELTNSSEILSGVSGILATSVFGQQLFLLHYHSTDHVGLEGHYHWLLQLIVFLSLAAALSATSSPTSFPAALVLSISVIFQGCWFMNMGFMLWDPRFVPQGCVMQLADASSDIVHGAVMCTTHEAGLRARALANLQFSWILAGILIFTGCICLKFSRRSTPKGHPSEYEQLHSRGAEATVAITGFKQAYP
uniref:Transmembrane protein 45B n=1 Tax=Davidia involucrata TaxID=16924 RepID=A0A5B7BJH2_DAVIN